MTTLDTPSMRSNPPVEFEVAPPSLGYPVSVRLRDFQERWLAVAECRRELHRGLGATARDALTAALAPLGPRAAATLMADPAMFGASLALRVPAQ